MDIESKLCRWAEQRYGLTGVSRVDFDVLGPISGGCDTCGYGSEPARVEITVHHSGGVFYTEDAYAGELIRDILAT